MLPIRHDKTISTQVSYLAYLGIVLSFILFSFFYSGAAHSAESDETSSLIEYLVQQKSVQILKLNEIKNLSLPDDLKQYDGLSGKLDVLYALNQVNQANLNNLLSEQKSELEKLNKKLKQGLVSQNRSSEKTLEDKNKGVRIQVQVHEDALELIKANLNLTAEIADSLNKKQQALYLWKEQYQIELKISDINQKIDQLKKEISSIYNANIKFQQEKSVSSKNKLDIQFESELMLNNQQALLLYSKIAILEQQKKQLKAKKLMAENSDIQTYESIQAMHQSVVARLNTVEQDLTHIQRVLSSDGLSTRSSNSKQYDQLQTELKQTIDKAISVKTASKTSLVVIDKNIKKMQAFRQSLSEYHFKSWPSITLDILSIPYKSYLYLKNLIVKVYENYYWLSAASKAFFWLGLCFIFISAFAVRKLVDRYSQDKVRLKLSGHLYDWLLNLINRNIPQITLLCLVIFTFKFSKVSINQYHLLINLILVWLIYRNVILIGRLMLLERLSDVSGEDVKLYYRLKYLMIYGGAITALMVFSHQFPLSFILQDIFNRLFMLFLLALAIGIWKSKEAIPYLLKPILKAKKKYIKRAIVLLITLIPITLFSTAIIGLIGFSSLAWTMSRYQADFLVVITAYVLLRGLLSDLLELISELMINKLKNGWLWIEVILKPIDKILRLLLLLCSVFFLFQLYGWSSDSLVMQNLEGILTYPLINISGIHITFMSCIQFLILLYVFLWASKWTREFGYRWLFKNARDAGIRNSLSAFTQYGVILIGAFVTLRVLGIDFSGMSMILGGLAVGMGFGLRDFASNIIGGIMLLIERPVREGDLITLGDYEGKVAHIGIRSMRVSSWDNMEVLIPNAETFNKPFTNWTHQDNIVRSVIPIKVNPGDEPVFIQQLILDVLAIIPEVLDDPAPQVYLKHINEALIEFEVRYYINVLENTRFAVRSNVLFAITAQFKAAGVKPPIPPLSIEVKENEKSKKDNQADQK